MPGRCDVAVVGGHPVGAIVRARAGLGVVCVGVVRLAIWRRPGLSRESQLSR